MAPFPSVGGFPWASDGVELLIDCGELEAAVVRLLKSAKRSVHYSFFICDLDKVVGEGGVTLRKLFQDCADRGVEINMLYNPSSDYGNANVADFVKQLPPDVNAIRVEGDGIIDEWWIYPFSANKFWSNHHQKFLCVDLERIMVTGVDINSERMPWLQPNSFGYFWHELSVILPMQPKMVAWLPPHFRELDLDGVPAPLVAGGRDEHDLMVDMIRTAEHSVQLENQAWGSGEGGNFRNRISEAIVDRISRAVEAGPERDDFRCVVTTNIGQDDEPSGGTRWFCRNAVLWSHAYVQTELLRRGLTPEQLAKRFVAAEMRHGKEKTLYVRARGSAAGEVWKLDALALPQRCFRSVKVHSNVLIVDSKYMIRSSSNLIDRSLWAQADSELGVGVRCNPTRSTPLSVFEAQPFAADHSPRRPRGSMQVTGPAVAAMQQRLFRRYLCLPGDSQEYISFERYFNTAVNSEGILVPLHKGDSLWPLAWKMRLATNLAGSILGFGKNVTWVNTPEKGGSESSASDVTKERSRLQQILR